MPERYSGRQEAEVITATVCAIDREGAPATAVAIASRAANALQQFRSAFNPNYRS